MLKNLFHFMLSQLKETYCMHLYFRKKGKWFYVIISGFRGPTKYMAKKGWFEWSVIGNFSKMYLNTSFIYYRLDHKSQD